MAAMKYCYAVEKIKLSVEGTGYISVRIQSSRVAVPPAHTSPKGIDPKIWAEPVKEFDQEFSLHHRQAEHLAHDLVRFARKSQME